MATFAPRHSSDRVISGLASRTLLALALAGVSPAFADEPPSSAAPTEQAAAPAVPPPAATAAPTAAPVATSPDAARAKEPDLSREQAQVAAATRREEEAKRSGKTGLAERLSALSTRWLAVMEALRTAAKLEAEAAALENERIRVQEQTDRVITLLEQTEARRARALARLQELGLEPRGLPVPPVVPGADAATPTVPAKAQGATP